MARLVEVGSDGMRPDQLKIVDGHVAVTFTGDIGQWLYERIIGFLR